MCKHTAQWREESCHLDPARYAVDMADGNLLRMLTRGTRFWNEHRPPPDAQSDLTHIRISNAVLREIDLRNVDLNGLALTNVDMRDSDLSGSRMNGARFHHVLLDGADLTGVEIKGGELTRVSLRRAVLRNVYVRQLTIRFSSLRDADMSDAVFDFNVHIYNSDVTRLRAEGITFEPGAGCLLRRLDGDSGRLERLAELGFHVQEPYRPLREEWPDFDDFEIHADDEERDLVEYEGMIYPISEGRYDFFVSHASVDKEQIALPLSRRLTELGFRVWIDQEKIRLGDDLARVIDFGISSSRYGVVVLSQDFIGRRWTERELTALSRSQMFLVLHGIEPERLEDIRPGLSDRLALSTSLGVDEVASRIAHAVRTRRLHLPVE
ncbi:toll/interleukin-1 receptor domain-containing protein [Streptomyces sp. NPDC086549]|uniref:toll/interleukin-1 receptor domain-containing protein n=1 Tax=Streptomyces sp. NPDC086549 TaxID=3365752 RepID=UPI0037F4836C